MKTFIKFKIMGNYNSGRGKYKTGVPQKHDLESLYHGQIKTQKEIGLLYGVSQKVVFGWFKDLGIKARIAYKRFQTGTANSSWKEDGVTYAAYHYRVKSAKGKAHHCEECGRSDYAISYDWANQTGHYEDINDYKQMCRSCHFKMDGHRNNLPNRIAPKNKNKGKILNGK